MKFGKIEQVHGTGRSFFVLQPNEKGANSVLIIEEQQSLLLPSHVGTEVEYELVDNAHKIFKNPKEHLWIEAKIIMYQNA